ncbi:hypothetical protein [Methylobacterium sp. Leaf106]|uniref:hypothetical protein n=1 Tax=Methylobacterium sp. Leaf106 TaxID=1736255 RepID=UPI0012E96178|nr:hypothetical protein [Methylobacterium sp. Leaf106]
MHKYLAVLRTVALTVVAFAAGAVLFTDNLSKLYDATQRVLNPVGEPSDIVLRDPSPIFLGRSRSIEGKVSDTVAVIAEFIITKKSEPEIENCEILFILGDRSYKDNDRYMALSKGKFDRTISGFFTFDKQSYSKQLKVRIECSNAVTGWLALQMPKLPLK